MPSFLYLHSIEYVEKVSLMEFFTFHEITKNTNAFLGINTLKYFFFVTFLQEIKEELLSKREKLKMKIMSIQLSMAVQVEVSKKDSALLLLFFLFL